MEQTTQEAYEAWIYEKCASVINSCTDIGHIHPARMYCKGFKRVYPALDDTALQYFVKQAIETKVDFFFEEVSKEDEQTVN